MKDSDIVVGKDLNRVNFYIENRSADSHETIIRFYTLPGQEVRVMFDGKPVAVRRAGERELEARVGMKGKVHGVTVELIN